MTSVTTPTTRLTRRVGTVTVVTAPADSRPRKRRARGAAVAVTLGFALALGAQAGIGAAVRSDSGALTDPLYHDKLALLRAHPCGAPEAGRPFSLLFLGSSRTYDAVNAGAAGEALARDRGKPVSAFDFAHSGAGPITTALYLRRLLQEGIRPDAVVIEVHPCFLAERSPPFEARWLSPIRLRPDELKRARDLGLPVEAGAGGWRREWLAGHEYRVHLLERYAPAFSPLQYRLAVGSETDPHGFVRVPELPEHQRAKLRAWTHKQYAPCWPGYRPGGSAVGALRDALGTCRANGIRAALLITPESTEFRDWYAEPGRARIAPVVGELASEFGAPFVDAREWLPDDLTADGHHLTGSGADAFTAKLVRDALAPWLRAPAAGGAQ